MADFASSVAVGTHLFVRSDTAVCVHGLWSNVLVGMAGGGCRYNRKRKGLRKAQE